MTDQEFRTAVLERLDTVESLNRSFSEIVEKFGASVMANTKAIDLHNEILAALNNHVGEIKNRLGDIDGRLDRIENLLGIVEQEGNLKLVRQRVEAVQSKQKAAELQRHIEQPAGPQSRS